MPSSIVQLGPLTAWIRKSGPALAQQVAKFGVVGVVAFVVDVAIFNSLQYLGARPLLAGNPLLAKVISTTIATVVSWLGNRYWTFRRTRRREMRREFIVFAVMCAIGLGISLVILWFSHYVLGLTSPLADNIAANVVGLAAASTFRFWAYRRVVFVHAGAPVDPPASFDDHADVASRA